MVDTIGAISATSATVGINSSYTSTIDFNGDIDLFRVELTAGTTYIFDLEGLDTFDNPGATLINPWLALQNASGVVLVADNDAGIGTSARIYFTPAVSGAYYLSAEEFGHNATGAYTVRVGATPIAGTISIGGSRNGSVDYAGDTDLWQVALTAGTAYVFDITGSTLSNPLLELLDSFGAVLLADDDSGAGLNSSLVFIPTTSGIYYLAARASANNASGAYTLSAQPLPNVNVSVSDANVVEPDSGTAAAVFTLSLSGAASRDVTVTYTTSNDLALAGTDYVAATGQVVIPAGSTSATFSVNVLGDTLFEPNETFVVKLSNPVNAAISDGTGFGVIRDNDSLPSMALPSDTHFRWQWSLFSPYGANILPVWNDYTGQGIRVAVFDQGIDGSHPDLGGNLLSALGRDTATLLGNGLPKLSGDNHGTAVAGVIGAERNGIGIVGVAYGVDLVSIYSPFNESVPAFGASVTNAYADARAVGADIINDSWGYAPQRPGDANYAFIDSFATANFAAVGLELYSLAAFGRDALGIIVVQSAGNSYKLGDDTNLHNFQNSRYIITVAASDYFGQAASYSSPGTSILVTAPGGENGGATGILTTDRVGTAGFSTSDYTFLTGTSFAAPIVSGVVALMLEANPNLGYRDVQEILAYSARQIGADLSNLEFNGADNWNGGGLHYDMDLRRFGFGLVDATAAVRLAETWGAAHTIANLQELSFTRTPNTAIPDNNMTGISDTISVTQHMQIERVDVTLNLTHPFIGDLSIVLQSPSGVQSALLYRPGAEPNSAIGSSQNNIHFTFDTVANWGEDSAGLWTLRVTDQAVLESGTLDNWTLTLTGKAESDSNTYIFTNEYAESLLADPTRGTLGDEAGIDTLNAAAVTVASTINLTPGVAGTIDGASFVISAGTVIENVLGGDGNDSITGNSATNWLRGMHGNDALAGGDGNDMLEGGAGNDMLDGGSGVDSAILQGARSNFTIAKTMTGYTITDNAGTGGIDTLYNNIERIKFTDGTLGLDTVSGSSGVMYRLYKAAFDRVPDAPGLGHNIHLVDGGLTLAQMSDAFVVSAEFTNTYGALSNAQFVNQLYANVLDRTPDAPGLAWNLNLLNTTLTRAAMLSGFSESAENQAAVIGQIQDGIWFV